MHALSRAASRHSRVMKPNVCRHKPPMGNWPMMPTVSSAHFGSAISGKPLAFVQEVGELAESEGHHPDISFGWGYATISLSTKKIKGLHENDFIMATKIARIFDRSNRSP